MGRRAIIGALLLIGVGVILGGTLLQDQIASARSLAQDVFVNNTAANPVPVREQGPVQVLPLTPVTSGGGGVLLAGSPSSQNFNPSVSVTALSIHLTSGIFFMQFTYQGAVVATFVGPAENGNSSIVLPLNRPIRFDRTTCSGTSSSERCTISWVGAQP